MTERLSPDTANHLETRDGTGDHPDTSDGTGNHADTSDGTREGAGPGSRTGDHAAPADSAEPLPDLAEIDLETLRTLDHPVLAEMVDELRERAERPREMLWGFTNAF